MMNSKTVPQKPPRRRRAFRWLRRLLGALLALYVAAAVLPYAFPPSQPQEPLPVREALAQTDAPIDRAAILSTGSQALRARLTLIHNARESLRVGSYIYAMDESGTQVTAALYAAAQRGVKVQIIIDGLIGMVNLKNDAKALALGAHPNVELRYYNPVRLEQPYGLNARYHEKFLVADDRWLVLGGRNIADEFLTETDAKYNDDQDVLLWRTDPAQRDAVSLMAEYFDEMWASGICQSVFAQVPPQRQEAARLAAEQLEQLARDRAVQLDLALPDPERELVPVRGARLLVNPITPRVKAPALWNSLVELMNGAAQRVWIETPYLVMDAKMRDDLAALAQRPVETRLLVNSRATGNNIMASADYTLHAGMARRLGLELCELQGQRSMHTKSVLIDQDISVFGSFNFDMRSAYIDTELMLVLQSEELNALLEKEMERFYGQALPVTPEGGYEAAPAVEAQPMGFWKGLVIAVLSPFVSLFRFLA